MILGAGEYQVPLIERALEMGLYCIVVSSPGNYPGTDLADKVYSCDVRDHESILNAARDEHINGIITDQTDMPVRTVAYIAEQLNLPGIGASVADLFSDKYLMRQKCESLGITTARYKLVDSLISAENFIEQVGYPVVIKPVDNQGSRGVLKITSESEVEQSFIDSVQYSRNGRVLIEEFVEGNEFVVESMAYNGNYQNLIIGDSCYFNIKNRFLPKQRVFPSDQQKEICNRVLETDKRVVTGFGLSQGITHGEYIVNVKTGRVCLIEIGARGGGVNISSHVISALTGLDVETFLLTIALGEPVDHSISKQNSGCAGYVAFLLPAGRIADIRGVDELSGVDGVIRHNLDTLRKGQQIAPFDDKTSRKTIIFHLLNRAEMNRLIERLKSLLLIRVETSEGLVGPQWD